jgi:hypothetical protein
MSPLLTLLYGIDIGMLSAYPTLTTAIWQNQLPRKQSNHRYSLLPKASKYMKT